MAEPLTPRTRRSLVEDVGRSETWGHLRALTAVSAAVAEGEELDETLERIAESAAEVVHAKAAAIILREEESETGLCVAGSYGLSEQYWNHVNQADPIGVGKGPSGAAVRLVRPICVEDVLDDPVYGPWREIAVHEHYRSMVSMPLRTEAGPPIGVLNAYREEPGPWTTQQVTLLSLLADHAAIAIRTARLLEDSRRQVAALSLMVRSLRAQTHEHSNRMHVIYGLLSMGEIENARRLIAAVEDAYHSTYASISRRIESPALAGLLLAETAIAQQSGITLTLDRRSLLTELPGCLDELDVVTLVGNLLHNAVEAVSDMPPSRRKVVIRLNHDPDKTSIKVRDWGRGLAAEDAERIFDRDFTTKPGHSGVGLALVRNIVSRVRGRIDLEHPRSGGLAVSVVVPH